MFVTEVLQLKRAVTGEPSECKQQSRTRTYSGAAPVETSPRMHIRLPSSLPMSVIANEFASDHEFFAAARKIYRKYIDPAQARLEVNISYETRGRLMQMFNNCKGDAGAQDGRSGEATEEILAMFEAAVAEIASLMSHSFRRFMRSDVFRELNKTRSKLVEVRSESKLSTPLVDEISA